MYLLNQGKGRVNVKGTGKGYRKCRESREKGQGRRRVKGGELEGSRETAGSKEGAGQGRWVTLIKGMIKGEGSMERKGHGKGQGNGH